jgi:protein-S-isoprenylcysteine O-methyltransferase Ste14
MIELVKPQPVGTPGLIALMAGFALFTLALLVARMRLRRDPDPGPPARKSAASLVGIAIQGVSLFIVGFGPILAQLPPASPLAIEEGIAVGVLMAMAAGLFHASSRAMGRNWAVVAQTRSDHALVTSGPFAWVRNPIYLAIFAMQPAFAIAFGHWRGLIIGVPLYWLGTWLRVAQEEKLLRAQFGEAYDAYARRVKRFVPGII